MTVPRTFLFLAGLVLAASHGAAQNPVKLATGTRFDLMAEAAVGALEDGVILQGAGTMQRMNWIPAQDQPRGYTCNFNVVHFGWLEILVQFTPQNSGNVQLSLMGPWEQSTEAGNPIYRQEVLWDALTATHATLVNGGFEQVNGTLPTGWTRTGTDAAVDGGPVAPVEGARYARTWHNSNLRQNLAVSAGHG